MMKMWYISKYESTCTKKNASHVVEDKNIGGYPGGLIAELANGMAWLWDEQCTDETNPFILVRCPPTRPFPPKYVSFQYKSTPKNT